ncbi:K(+)/H(+) antiporter [Tilletia horrida]|nr:K(+)/H(+) antiporter [Tilletia horrida]
MFETSATSLRASLGSDHVARLVARASGAKSDSILAGVNPATYSTADPIRLFIIQAAIIIVMTRLIAIPLAKIRQPIVIAEVITGILLGPSVMGHIPKFSSTIFPTASLVNLNLMANVGLVLFMFTVGLEVDLAIISKNLRAAAYVGLAGISLPFALGAAISVGIFNDLIKTSPALQGNDVTFGHFLLFSGVAMAITAFPVLARILTETKLLATKVGTVVLAAGVANDVVGWVLLALTVALVNASSGLTALYVLLTTIAYALFLFLGVRPVFVWLAKRTGSLENGPTQTMTTITILLVLISAWFTDIVGVHARLKTNLGALNSGTIWGYTVGIIAIAFISKFAGCAGAARWACRFSLRESVAVGTLMSCKGLVELIVLNIGLNAGILDTSTFSMFVVMAIVSTVATTPLTLWAYPPHLRETADSHLIHSGKGAASEGQDPSAGFGSEGGEKDGLSTSGKPIYQRLLVVLDRFENLPGLMTVIQLVQPFTSVRRGLVSEDSDDSDSIDAGTGAHSESSGDHQEGAQAQADSDEKKANSIVVATPILRSDAPHVLAGRVAPAGPTVRVSALRLIELTDRLSAVMKAADALVLESQRALDPLLAVFRTFASLHGLRVEGEELAIVERDEYARTVQNRDDRERKDRTLSNSGSHKEKGLVLVPWTLPHAYHSFAYPSTSLIGSPVGVVTPSVVPRSNPFESIFGRSSTSAADATDYSSSSSSDIGGGPQQASFVRRLFQGAHTSDIGLVLDRPASAAAATALLLPGANSAPKRVLLAFMGGPDDRAALSLVLSLCDVNENLRVTVLRLKRAADDDEEAAAEAGTTGQSLPPTVHHATGARSGASGIPAFTAPNQGGTVQDTIYPAQAGSSGMQASLEDDVAIESAKKHPACAQRGQVRFVHRAAAFPLSELLTVSEAAQGNAGGENDNADWLGQAFSLIIVGRGRRMPTMTHRAELKALLASAASNARSTSTGGSSAEILSRIPNSQPATRAAALVRARAVPSSAGNHGLHAGALDSDTCKVIGEPAMALMLARISAPTLVIAASATTANSSLRA